MPSRKVLIIYNKKREGTETLPYIQNTKLADNSRHLLVIESTAKPFRLGVKATVMPL